MHAVVLGLGVLAGVGCGTPTTTTPTSTTPKPPGVVGAAFDYDRGLPLNATAAVQSETDVARTEQVAFTGAGGDRVPALLSLPKGARGAIPCVLVGHALTSSKEEVFAEKADEYAARGVGLFAIDARYHGERQAGIGPERAVARLDTLHKLFRLTVIDMRRGLDYLAQRKVCDPDRTGYEGRSLGGFMGSMLVGADPRIKAAVLYVSGADWRKYFANSAVFLGGPLSGRRLDEAVRRMADLDPKYWIARADGRPVFMAAGRRDEATPFISAQALHRAATTPKEVVVFDGGHDIEEPHGTRVYRAATAFLKRHLRL